MWDKCNDTRKCYARNEAGGCMILTALVWFIRIESPEQYYQTERKTGGGTVTMAIRCDVIRGLISLLIGNLITLVIFSALHAVFSPLEVVCFWVGTWFIATYAVWSVIDILDRKKA